MHVFQTSGVDIVGNRFEGHLDDGFRYVEYDGWAEGNVILGCPAAYGGHRLIAPVTHLTRRYYIGFIVYRKIDVSSRAELVRRLSGLESAARLASNGST